MPIMKQCGSAIVTIQSLTHLKCVLGSMLYFAAAELKEKGGCSLVLADGVISVEGWGNSVGENAWIYVPVVGKNGAMLTRSALCKLLDKLFESCKDQLFPLKLQKIAMIKPSYTRGELKVKVAEAKAAMIAEKLAKQQKKQQAGKKKKKSAEVNSD